MKIQSLSVVVPSNNCVNSCKCCVSRMHLDADLYRHSNRETEIVYGEYLKRLNFARDNGCNTLLITGSTEPQQNMTFIKRLGKKIREMDHPFRWVEIQTTGVLFDEGTFNDLREVGVNTVALSIFSFDDEVNKECRGSNLDVDIRRFCQKVKEWDFNLRICVNLSDYITETPDEIFKLCKDLGADQVTIRKLWHDGSGSEQSMWCQEHDTDLDEKINNYLSWRKTIRKLETGPVIRDVMGMGVVFDGDCMARDKIDETELRYLVLRPNGKLYSAWDTPASLVF